jgi:Na+-transporting NADH:ubiquinone oxidoreductase subunit B
VAVGWAFATLSFPAAFGFGWSRPFPGYTLGFGRYAAALLTVIHPIELLAARAPVPLEAILRGDFPQTPGNAVPLVTLACGVLLLALRVVDWRSALSFLGTTAVLMLLATRLFPARFPPLSSLLVANFLPAGLFIYPDYRTVARTFAGRWITGAVAGTAALIVLGLSSFADGVLFAVLFGNVFAAIIDEGVLSLKQRRAAHEGP